MKKANYRVKITQLITILLLLLILPLLCSCVFAIRSPKFLDNLPYEMQDKIVDSVSDIKSKAELIYGLGINKIDRADSMTYNEKLYLKYKDNKDNETKVTIEATQKTVYEKQTLTMELDSKYDVSLKILGQSSRSSFRTVEGYQDGCMYIKPNASGSGMYSEISKKEYLEHLSSRVESNTSILDCGKFEYKKTEEGFHELTLSEYSDEVIKKYSELIEGYDKYAPDYTLEDINTVIKLDEYYWINEIVTNLVFQYASEDWTMKATLTATYTDIYETEIDKNDFDTFTKVEDLRKLYDISDILNTTSTAEKGTIAQKYQLKHGTKSQNIDEYITFSNTEKALSYTINTKNGRIVFKDGSMDIYDMNGTKTYTSTVTREEAYPLLQVYYNPLSITILSPKDFTYTLDGEKQVYTLKIEKSINDTVIPSLVGKTSYYNLSTVDIEVTLTVENGHIIAYDYTINTKYDFKDINLTVTTSYKLMEYPSKDKE